MISQLSLRNDFPMSDMRLTPKTAIAYEVWLPDDAWGDGFKPFVVSSHRAAQIARDLCREWDVPLHEADTRPTVALDEYVLTATEDEILDLEYASRAARVAAVACFSQLTDPS